MRRRSVIIILSVALTAVAAVGAFFWFRADSYDDKIADCKRLIAAHDFDANPVEEGGTLPGCEELKRDDYLALLLANTIDDMPKEQRDVLDYYDNGTIDGSIG